MRENRIRPVGGEEIADYRNAQDAYYPTMHVMANLKAETGDEYEMYCDTDHDMVSGHWSYVGPYVRVMARTDRYGIAVSPDSTNPVDVRRNYERTLPKEERRKIQIKRMFALS